MQYLSIICIVFNFLSMVNTVKPSLKHLPIAEHRLIMQDRAILHINLMNTNGLCRDPRPLVIYPPSTPNKIYYPRGTVSNFILNVKLFLLFIHLIS